MHTAHQGLLPWQLPGCGARGNTGWSSRGRRRTEQTARPRIPAGDAPQKPEPASPRRCLRSDLRNGKASASSPAPLPVSVALAKPAADVAPAARGRSGMPRHPPFFPRSGAIPNWPRLNR
jgi:hypothetical protein